MSTQYSHPFTSRLVDIEDGAIEIWEGGDGPVTFVTMHPYLISNGEYLGAGLADGLASVGRTVFVTPRGSGGSFAESRREKLGMDTLTDDLEQVRLALGVEKWIPSGFSCGGMVTLMYASRYPGALAGAVPICTAASYHVVVEEVLVGKWNYEPELPKITAPTLIIVGRHDAQAGSMLWSHKILVGIPGSELAVMNNSGHFPHEEEPGEFRRVIKDFVQRRLVAPA
jgi:pimeloyl-ACP methyl ester carboxylesterase